MSLLQEVKDLHPDNIYDRLFRRSTETLRLLHKEGNENVKKVIENIFLNRNVPLTVPENYQEPNKEIFEAKKEARIGRLETRLENKTKEAHDNLNTARKMGEAIPFGQPILVGHHSEKRDRNYRNKIERKYEKGFEALEESKELERRLKAAESNTAISSDDPEAIQKLELKLSGIEAKIEQIKEHNKKVKNNIQLEKYQFREGYETIINANGHRDIAKIIDGVLSWDAKKISDKVKTTIEEYHKSGVWNIEKLPDDQKMYPSYHLQNLNGTKAQIRKRIENIKAQRSVKEVDEEINGIRVFTDKDENRVKIYFGFKPDEETIRKLKQNGFRWSRYNETWQKPIQPYYIDQALNIAKEYKN